MDNNTSSRVKLNFSSPSKFDFLLRGGSLTTIYKQKNRVARVPAVTRKLASHFNVLVEKKLWVEPDNSTADLLPGSIDHPRKNLAPTHTECQRFGSFRIENHEIRAKRCYIPKPIERRPCRKLFIQLNDVFCILVFGKSQGPQQSVRSHLLQQRIKQQSTLHSRFFGPPATLNQRNKEAGQHHRKRPDGRPGHPIDLITISTNKLDHTHPQCKYESGAPAAPSVPPFGAGPLGQITTLVNANAPPSYTQLVVSALGCHRPPFGIVENVAEFVRWALFPAWCAALTALGYAIAPHLIDAADHGVPQHRRRVFIVLSRSKHPIELRLENRKHASAIDFIDFNAGRWTPIERPGRSRATLARIAEGRRVYGDRFLSAFYGNERGGRSLSRPIGTITTRDRWAIINGDRMRMLSVAEARCAMGFRSDYQLPGDVRKAMHMLGNAVCPAVPRDVIAALKVAA